MNDRDYYARRADQERAAAQHAADAATRARHLELADLLASYQGDSVQDAAFQGAAVTREFATG